ncbi:hypothetical protein OKW21_001104 [Catalinimonas alkaloidigena]|nr:hypothetical protein [Catalinimonas alkaloidigena]MDF9795841.1 hypothetical protein [Catalinimonas alkaloidigena]
MAKTRLSAKEKPKNKKNQYKYNDGYDVFVEFKFHFRVAMIPMVIVLWV